MKIVIAIIRWLIGLFLCLGGLGGLLAADYLTASLLLIVGMLFLPPVTLNIKRLLRNYPVTPAQLPSHPLRCTPVQELDHSQTLLPEANNKTAKQPKNGWLRRIENWWNAIRVSAALEKCIKRFRRPPTQDLAMIRAYLDKCDSNEHEILRLRLIGKYNSQVNCDTVKIDGPKYLDLYTTLFPGLESAAIEKAIATHHVENFAYTKVNDDDVLDPNEIDDICNYSKQLSVSDYDTPQKIADSFDYYVMNWKLDNGVFEGVKSNFILNKNELCISKHQKCEWFERKSVTNRVTYGGLSYKMKITKGLSYRLGSYSVSTNKEIVRISKGKGIINITTKRILFKSEENTSSINISSIIDIEPFTDAVTIYKSKGHPVTIESKDPINIYKHLRSATRKTLINA